MQHLLIHMGKRSSIRKIESIVVVGYNGYLNFAFIGEKNFWVRPSSRIECWVILLRVLLLNCVQ